MDILDPMSLFTFVCATEIIVMEFPSVTATSVGGE
jgi:hypothetical protein